MGRVVAILTTLQRWAWLLPTIGCIVLGALLYSAASELADERAMRLDAERRVGLLIEASEQARTAAAEEQAARVELEVKLADIETERAKVEAETAARLEELAAVPDEELAAYVNEWIEGRR
jgi:pyridoxine 5'-phosphate synthase PdxJ